MNIFVICMLVAGMVVVLTFAIAFFTEIILDKALDKKVKVKEVNSSTDEIDLDEMLRALDEKTKVIESAKKPEEVKEVEDSKKDDESISDDELDALLENLSKRNTKVVEKEAEVKADNVEEVKVEEVKPEKTEVKPEKAEVKPVVNKTKEPAVAKASEIDYKVRLEKMREGLDGITSDYDKAQSAVAKFERTQRRIERNEKLLNKKAGDLANLNLVMYKVNNIKDVGTDKKQKQEELTALVAEIKGSIADGKDYIKKNKVKNEANVKLCEYLEGEKKRYADEIVELEKLVGQAE
ncbi:MAG: hypothetical protein RR334_00755 [Clostridia bacterium]